MFGEDYYTVMGQLARSYLDTQQLRIAVEARIRKIKEDGATNEEILKVMETHHARLRADEKEILKDTTAFYESHPLWTDFCEKVRGLGAVAILTFLGYIHPYHCDTAGKIKAYLGLIPDAEMKAGKKANFNPEAKGRFIGVLAKNVIMAGDSYYTELYHRKKEYYLWTSEQFKGIFSKATENGEEKVVANPEMCTKYAECLAKMQAKAKRLKRVAKKPACLMHADRMAVRWMTELLVSHALEIMRTAEGLDVSAFRAHKNYIPPPL